MLIDQGLSNRAVGERLTLSVRTVESHIYRAVLKTKPPAATNSPPCYPATRRGERILSPDGVRSAPAMISVSPY
jgi:hypothetical protein